MIKVKILIQGRCKESWLKDALQEYEKRLLGRMQIEWIWVEKEEQLVAKALEMPPFIALDVAGRLLSSEELSHKMFSEWGSRIYFVIGGPEGLAEPIRQKAMLRWSLSPLTFTHQMVRLLLTEQLYRAYEIANGGCYHRG